MKSCPRPAKSIISPITCSAIKRREASFRDKAEVIAYQLEQDMRAADESDANELQSDQLAMMFACCHPCLPREMQIALTLKILCGLSVPEIARAFLVEEGTIAQRLVRAKRKIRDEKISFKKGQPEKAADYYQQALALAGNEPERRFLQRKRKACGANPSTAV
jgi:RNA polymerase sigma-70 factor (ECF subfamily)